MCDWSSEGHFMGPQPAVVRGKPAASAPQALHSSPSPTRGKLRGCLIPAHRLYDPQQVNRWPGQAGLGRHRRHRCPPARLHWPALQCNLHVCSCVSL